MMCDIFFSPDNEAWEIMERCTRKRGVSKEGGTKERKYTSGLGKKLKEPRIRTECSIEPWTGKKGCSWSNGQASCEPASERGGNKARTAAKKQGLEGVPG